jgi:hypothetical protein
MKSFAAFPVRLQNEPQVGTSTDIARLPLSLDAEVPGKQGHIWRHYQMTVMHVHRFYFTEPNDADSGRARKKDSRIAAGAVRPRGSHRHIGRGRPGDATHEVSPAGSDAAGHTCRTVPNRSRIT